MTASSFRPTPSGWTATPSGTRRATTQRWTLPRPAQSADHKVNLPPVTTPTIASVAIISDPGDDGVYSNGDEILVSVAFFPPGEITVTGTPQLTLNIGGDGPDGGLQDLQL